MLVRIYGFLIERDRKFYDKSDQVIIRWAQQQEQDVLTKRRMEPRVYFEL